MQALKYLLSAAVAVFLFSGALGTGSALGQELGSGEGVIPGPKPSVPEGELVNPESLMPFLYFLLLAMVVVAAVATILLAMGRGEMRGRKPLTEGERRLGRMLKEGETEFEVGRRAEELPDHMKT